MRQLFKRFSGARRATRVLPGRAQSGWGAEILPVRRVTLAGWRRVGRWLCALVGSVLAALSLFLNLSFGPVYGIVILGMGLLQALEFSPGGPANKP